MSKNSTFHSTLPGLILEASKTDKSFLSLELPTVIRGGVKNWPAFEKWTAEFFTKNYGNVEVPLSNYKKDPYQKASTKNTLSIKNYLESAQRIAAGEADDNEDMYSAGWFFKSEHSELKNDVLLPEYFQKNWADKVQKAIRFETDSILFGHPKVESPLHTDSFFVSTYIAMIKGTKRLRLVHPKYTPFVHNGYDVFDEQKLQRLFEQDVPVYECVAEEGDLVWFPPGWWHHVKNESFTISLTTNFVSDQHFLAFEQQVRATIVKPMLALSKLKADWETESHGAYSLENLENSKYVKNEEAYSGHFQKDLTQSMNFIEKLKL